MRTYYFLLLATIIELAGGCNTKNTSGENNHSNSSYLDGNWYYKECKILDISFKDESSFDIDRAKFAHFSDVIKIKNDSLKVEPYKCSYDIYLTKQSTISYFHSISTVNYYKKALQTGFGINLGDSIQIIMNEYNNEGCPYPFQAIFVFNDKLIIVDNFFLFCFTHEKPPQLTENPNKTRGSKLDCGTPNCSCEEGGTMETGFYTTCSYFSVSSLSKLYNIIYAKYPEYKNEILKKLPDNNVSLKGTNAITITYHIKSDSIHIDIQFEGGNDEMILTKKDNYTIFTLVKNPD